MRASVKAAWPAFCTRFEGRTSWMYLDVKSKVTCGTGNLIDSIAAAQVLPWLTKANRPASPSEIAAEWRRVKSHTEWAKLNGLNSVWRDSAVLHLAESALDKLLLDKTAEFWTRLLQTLPALELWPADAQLAILDEAWQNGPAFLDLKTSSGAYVWAGTRAAVLARDWIGAARHVPGSGARAAMRQRLFTNAATVVALGIDPAILWLNDTPTKPPTPDFDLEAEIMAMTPEQRKQFANEIADAILARDSVKNTFTGNKSNPTVAPSTALASIGDSLGKIKAKLGVK